MDGATKCYTAVDDHHQKKKKNRESSNKTIHKYVLYHILCILFNGRPSFDDNHTEMHNNLQCYPSIYHKGSRLQAFLSFSRNFYQQNIFFQTNRPLTYHTSNMRFILHAIDGVISHSHRSIMVNYE